MSTYSVCVYVCVCVCVCVCVSLLYFIQLKYFPFRLHCSLFLSKSLFLFFLNQPASTLLTVLLPSSLSSPSLLSPRPPRPHVKGCTLLLSLCTTFTLTPEHFKPQNILLHLTLFRLTTTCPSLLLPPSSLTSHQTAEENISDSAHG